MPQLLDDPLIRQALHGVLPPAVLSSTALLVAWRPWRPRAELVPLPGPDGRRAARRGAWGTVVALGCGYAAGHVAVAGWPAFPRFSGTLQGMLYVAAVATLLGLVEAFAGPSRPARHGVRLAASLALPWFLLEFKRRLDWSPGEAAAWTVALGLGTFAAWSLIDRSARERSGPVWPLAWLGVLVLTSGALQVAGSSSLAQLAGALAAPVAVCVPIAWRVGAFRLAWGATACLVPVLAGLLMAGRFSADAPAPGVLALGVAPLLPLVGDAAWMRERPRLRAIAPVAAAWLVAALGLALTVAGLPDDPYAGY